MYMRAMGEDHAVYSSASGELVVPDILAKLTINAFPTKMRTIVFIGYRLAFAFPLNGQRAHMLDGDRRRFSDAVLDSFSLRTFWAPCIWVPYAA
jgi:hypothetical protein